MIGLFIGRFQPPHNGHMRAIKHILKNCPHLIILVGSAQKSHTRENPFTTSERMEMLSRALAAQKLSKRCTILPITDIDYNGLWVPHVIATAPPFDIVYTNNALVKKLFQEKGFEVKKIPFFSRKSLEGTRLRSLIAKGKAWKRLVPPQIIKFLKEINGVGRVKELEK